MYTGFLWGLVSTRRKSDHEMGMVAVALGISCVAVAGPGHSPEFIDGANREDLWNRSRSNRCGYRGCGCAVRRRQDPGQMSERTTQAVFASIICSRGHTSSL